MAMVPISPTGLLRRPPKNRAKFASMLIGDCHDQRVAAFDVGQLVPDHTGQLGIVQTLHQSGRYRDRGVFRTTAGRKGVGLWVVHDIDPRHRQAATLGKPGDHVVKLWLGFAGDLAGPVLTQNNRAGVPIGEGVHPHRHDERDQQSALTAD
jgi:hypothetical protein